MSVDDRLREAFGETDRTWDEQVPEALAALTARRHRESAVRRGAAAALIAAAAVAAIAVTVSQRAGSNSDPAPEPKPTPTPSSTAGPGSETNPLAGTWVSQPISRADVRRAARLAGDAGDADAMLAELPSLPVRVALYVNGDRSSIHAAWRAEGQAEQNADEENVTISGDRLVMQPMFDAAGENVHTWVLEDGTLRLAFVSTTEPASDGVPGEAWQRLVYDAATFTPGT
jgi:hypothetical protein